METRQTQLALRTTALHANASRTSPTSPSSPAPRPVPAVPGVSAWCAPCPACRTRLGERRRRVPTRFRCARRAHVPVRVCGVFLLPLCDHHLGFRCGWGDLWPSRGDSMWYMRRWTLVPTAELGCSRRGGEGKQSSPSSKGSAGGRKTQQCLVSGLDDVARGPTLAYITCQDALVLLCAMSDLHLAPSPPHDEVEISPSATAHSNTPTELNSNVPHTSPKAPRAQPSFSQTHPFPLGGP